ncbi:MULTISPECIES: bifunctional hydroxymethylpyrimidine kinase/phosphomethylpyrimidine kinase [Silvimonas]|uniref:bifunctional hydroxymethylpyrimidine kinase/phosphomethylpyrimidine kinase n=1 Tax=Silvimonas TaxID=300264 RepID=UPI0024B38230|nr:MULTISPECIES: bifunctional hydroxymethylpyrimidine kinase/phosphomethylpyrimidine kinase [Silvimonas]MDR3428306.1 bifunctional hydroxymethylpyrimidine kinase/phosphomethylpyrimidine kinase [Silvimonas sp.]
MSPSTIPHALTIAGSDSGGGAGIQADLKTFSALGAYGMSVLTALTAQNTQGVHAVHPVPPEFVTAQLDAVFSDIRVDAVKLGMLANAGIVHAVAASLAKYQPTHIVLDTVMIAKGGHPLLVAEAVSAIRDALLPLASLITPNLPEAAALLGAPVATTEDEMRAQGYALIAAGAKAVLMKGGHLGGAESPDWLITPQSETRFANIRIATRNTHGTGCTLSAALAALRPQHQDWPQTVAAAREWLQAALIAADRLDVGHGIGPVHHFHAWW